MKKFLLITAGVLGGLALLGGAGVYLYIQSLMPAAEERISHNNAQVIAAIDQQLEGIDQEAIKGKASLMANKSIDELQELVDQQSITYEELVAYYLMQIKDIDQSPMGNNAVSEINPNAMAEARRLDQELGKVGPLHGMPVLVKENINTNNMPTSAGSYALRDFVPATNAPVVDKLLANGAIILGKTNLSEMSYFMSQKNPSGYSAKKGQTLNPFGQLAISASGSSSGSAVAMATDLAAVTLGTETAGSIVSPASVNSVVGYKPSHGSIAGEGVIPISSSLDTVGPITKTVKDAYLTYNASVDHPLEVAFDQTSLKGQRIGLVKSSDETFNQQVKDSLTKLGAEVELVELDSSRIDVNFILDNDFERDLNAYLTANEAPIASLKDWIAYNKEDEPVRARYGQSHMEKALAFSDHDDQKVKAYIKEAQAIIAQILADKHLSVLVAKDNEAAGLAATAGSPEISVPLGLSAKTPMGATFFASPNQDALVLQLAYAFEQGTQLRQLPPKN